MERPDVFRGLGERTMAFALPFRHGGPILAQRQSDVSWLRHPSRPAIGVDFREFRGGCGGRSGEAENRSGLAYRFEVEG